MKIETLLEEWFHFILEEVSTSYVLPRDCRGGTVIDCGSNVGAFPIVHNVRFDRYICYEADPRNVKFARKKLKQIDFNNGVGDVSYKIKNYCTIENRACCRTSGSTVPVYRRTDPQEKKNKDRPGDSAIYLSPQHQKENKAADVPTVAIEEIREKYFCETCKIPIQLLKCDIEGAEYEFLLEKDLSIFKFICMEIHGEEEKFYKMTDFLSRTHNILGSEGRVIIAKLKT